MGLAVALVVIPAVLGIAFLADDAEDAPGTTAGMGGDMGTTATTLAAGLFDFSEILDGEIDVQLEPDGSAAVIRLNTSIDVACAVAYGPTTAFGSLATDTDMAGSGHSVHQPRLVGLEADTEYFYRIQGVGGDGRIFVSDVMSFITGVSAGAETPAPNIATGGEVVDVSSEFSAAFAGENAIDGDLGTEWSSAGDGDGAFITIDLRFPAEVVGVGFRTRAMSDGTSITTSFSITVDGTQTFGPFDAGQGLVVVPVGFFGQVVRFDVETSTGGNTGAVEVEIYGSFPPPGSDM